MNNEVTWRKSSRSGAGGGTNDCVELAVLPTRTAIRDSKNPAGPALAFGNTAWAGFLTSVKRDHT